MIEKSNVQTSQDFLREYPQLQNQMDSLVGSHIDSHTKFCDSHRVSIEYWLLNQMFPFELQSANFVENLPLLI